MKTKEVLDNIKNIKNIELVEYSESVNVSQTSTWTSKNVTSDDDLGFEDSVDNDSDITSSTITITYKDGTQEEFESAYGQLEEYEILLNGMIK